MQGGLLDGVDEVGIGPGAVARAGSQHGVGPVADGNGSLAFVVQSKIQCKVSCFGMQGNGDAQVDALLMVIKEGDSLLAAAGQGDEAPRLVGGVAMFRHR